VSAERAGRLADLALVAFAFALPLSIAASEILLGIAILAWLASRPWRRPAAPGLATLGWITAGLAGTWVLASLTAADPGASLLKARKLYSIVLVFLVADRARADRTRERLAAAALVGGAVSAVIGIVSFFAIRAAGTIPGHRMRGVFSTSMTSGNVHATLGLVALGALLERRDTGRRALALAATALFAVALASTLTRSSWLAFLVGSALLIGIRRPRALALLVALAGIALVLGPAELRERARSIGDPTHVTNQGRISLWKSGLAVVADHPWTGVGLADHYALIERYRRPDATFHAGHFHSNGVQIAASTGLLGLAAYLAWMLAAAVLLVRRARGPDRGWARVGLAVGLAFQVHGFFDWSFGDAEVANQLFLWTGLGLAAREETGGAAAGRLRPETSNCHDFRRFPR
jgi:putative inorganic carbon (HCO3(-)) transporter